MATRGYVFLVKDGEANGVYINQDSYPSYAGKILCENYDTEEKLNELIRGGAIYSLDKNIDNVRYYPKSMDSWFTKERSFSAIEDVTLLKQIISFVEDELVIEWLYIFTENCFKIYHIKDLSGKRPTTLYEELIFAIEDEDKN